MTIREILTTKQRRVKSVERNNDNVRMEYPQIQFTSDCLRRYAIKKGKKLDEVLIEVQQAGGMDYIAALYAENPNQKAGVAARKLERKLRTL